MDKSNTAHLETLSFAKLENKDRTELARLFQASQQQGFFYLDLSNSSGAQGLADRLKALSLTTEWFDIPAEEKMKLFQDSVTKGYKPPGTLSDVEKNMKDGFENIKMPRDDFINGNNTLPEGLKDNIEVFRSDLESAHAVTTTLLSCFSDLLKPETRFEDYHRGTEASQSHYDVLPLYEENRRKGKGSRPQYAHRSWHLDSPLLRTVGSTVRVPGHATVYRYSTAYFLRPENDAKFMISEGTYVSALDWHDQKYSIFKAAHIEQAKNTVLTGGIDVKG